MKKSILVITAASSILLSSFMVQANDSASGAEITDIQEYVMELDTTGMTEEEIEATRGEAIFKVKWKCVWKIGCRPVRVKVGAVAGSRDNGRGGREYYFKNH